MLCSVATADWSLLVRKDYCFFRNDSSGRNLNRLSKQKGCPLLA